MTKNMHKKAAKERGKGRKRGKVSVKNVGLIYKSMPFFRCDCFIMIN